MGKTLLGCGFVLLSLAVGCGGSSNDDDDDTGGGIPLESMPSRYAALLCKLSYQCCTAEERGDNIFLGDTEAACKSNLAAFLTLGVAEWNQSIAKERLRYDGNAFATCVSQIEAAGCDAMVANATACETFFVPLVPSGGACTQQGECIDSACFGGDSTADVDGTCGPPVANGADCEDDVQCASGNCGGLVCEAKVANGATCAGDAECESGQCNTTTFVCETASSDMCGG